MCGISGVSSKGPEVDLLSKLELSNAALCHRGPDGSGVFIDDANQVGLAHTRLSIIDLSVGGNQPMIDRQTGVAIVFNGEIYNFRSIKRKLEKAGHTFDNQSDTEVLLRFYLANRDKDTVEFAQKLNTLNGIFSFAIWDSKKNELLLVRDAFGVKPLYYAQNENSFYFSSEIKSLLVFTAPDQPAHYQTKTPGEHTLHTRGRTSIDVASLEKYLTYLWCPGNTTPSEFFRKVGPGQFLRVKQGKIVETFNWYQLPTGRTKQAEYFKSDTVSDVTNIMKGLAKQIRMAVHKQLVSDVPVGAFLSGGLDSSSVVAFAMEKLPELECFTIKSDQSTSDGQVNDLPYAVRVAEHLDVKLNYVEVSSKDFIDDLTEMVWTLDEPLADPAALNVKYISKLAKKQGIKVLLSGTGGDDIFTGYRRHRAVDLEQRYLNLLPKKVLSMALFLLRFNRQDQNGIRRLAKFLRSASKTGDEGLIDYFKWSDSSVLQGLLSDDLKLNLQNQKQSDEPMMSFLMGLPRDANEIEKILCLEQRFFLSDHNLIYTDKMAMSEGIEVRVPLLDIDLVEYAAKIPTQLKQNGRIGKWIFKKAMEPFLPLDCIYRSKSGFGLPIQSWIRAELRDFVHDTLSYDLLKKRGVFNPEAIATLIKNNEEGRIDGGYTILSVICIELWFRQFID